MNLYSRYVKEREGFETLEIPPYAFATYKKIGPECYIRDIYIVPEKRDEGIAAKIADTIAKIAKDQGCKYLTGTVVPSSTGSTDSVKSMLKYGFKILKAEQDKIFFIKELP